jgi:hypothetical protein
MISIDVSFERLRGSGWGVLATRNSAAKPASVRCFMFAAEFFSLESHCRSGALSKAASKCGGSEMALEQFKFFCGSTRARVLIEQVFDRFLVRNEHR